MATILRILPLTNMSPMRHAFDPTTGRSISIAHRVEYDMFRFATGFLVLSAVTVSLQARANDVDAVSTDDVIYFTDDEDTISFESAVSTGSTAEIQHAESNLNADATFESWARAQIL